MQLTIGSNQPRKTDGSITVHGKRQILLEWGPFNSELMLTMDLYGPGGKHIARLWRNQWTFNDDGRFEFAGTARGFNLIDTRSSQVVLEARVVGRDSVAITQGAFYDVAGDQIEITMEDGNGSTDSQTATAPATRSTNPPFAADEVALIRKAIASSLEVVDCPRCGWPLTSQRMNSAARRAALMVSCMFCKRTLVIHGQP